MDAISILVIIGVAIGILLFIIFIVKNFYVKVDQGKALIVNKMKNIEVYFTGAIVYPVIHRKEVMDISLKTIEVDRQGQNGLICKDNVRADIKVAFFVRVNKTQEDVLNVAQVVGVDRASDKRTLEDLFMAKFSEALKTVGKQMEFVDLYNKRDEFKDLIVQTIGTDLNGYSLDAAAIDYLEQTPLESLDPDNILDAQGRRKIIDLTSEQKVQANDIERDAEKTIKKQDVEAKEAILALERQQADAEAVQEREIYNTRVREQAEMERVRAEEEQKAKQADLESKQEVGISEQNAHREIEVAEQNRQRAVLVEKERVEKERQLEAINRERATELSRIEKEKAIEVEKKNIADVIRERVSVEKTVAQEEERIKDLRATMTADREKTVAVTKASEVAEEHKIKEVKMAEAAELSATHNAKEKLVLAEAEQQAAEKEALAEIRRAEGTQASVAAEGLAKARVLEADAVAREKLGLAEARVKEADADATEKMGLADVHVKEADAAVIEKVGHSEAAAIQAKMSAEAAGLTEKADAMAKLNDSSKEHEEFRLTLEKDLEIAKDKIKAGVEIAHENASILAQAFKTANIDIVGGDGQFFDRMISAISVGKTIDATVEKSDTIQTLGKEYLDGSQSLPADVKEVLTNTTLGSGDIKNLVTSGVLAKLLKGKDPEKVSALINKAKELGFGDEIAGWLSTSK